MSSDFLLSGNQSVSPDISTWIWKDSLNSSRTGASFACYLRVSARISFFGGKKKKVDSEGVAGVFLWKKEQVLAASKNKKYNKSS